MDNMEQLLKSDNLKRIHEIKEKGVETATVDDIPKIYDVLVNFLNIDKEVQELAKNFEFSIVLEVKDQEQHTLTVKKGKCEHKDGEIDKPGIHLSSDLITIIKILLGQEDPTLAYFKGDLEIGEDVYYLILFQELLEIAFRKLDIVELEKRIVVLKPSEIQALLDVYKKKKLPTDPTIVANFLQVLTIFANNNLEAQEDMKHKEIRAQLIITDGGSYLIDIKNGVMNWSEESATFPTVSMEMPFETSAEIIIEGDPVSAYMEGKISIEGNMSEAMFIQELIQLMLDYVYYVEY